MEANDRPIFIRDIDLRGCGSRNQDAAKSYLLFRIFPFIVGNKVDNSDRPCPGKKAGGIQVGSRLSRSGSNPGSRLPPGILGGIPPPTWNTGGIPPVPPRV